MHFIKAKRSPKPWFLGLSLQRVRGEGVTSDATNRVKSQNQKTPNTIGLGLVFHANPGYSIACD
jgi:hypothetical protein